MLYGAKPTLMVIITLLLSISQITIGNAAATSSTIFQFLAGIENDTEYRAALDSLMQIGGSNHPDVATLYNDRAVFLYQAGRYNEAEKLYKQALAIRKSNYGSEHADVAQTINNLAALYVMLGRYSEAESLFGEALSIRNRILGSNNADYLMTLMNLADLQFNTFQYDKAQTRYKQALAISEDLYGQNCEQTAQINEKLGEIQLKQGNYNIAESYLTKSRNIYQNIFGSTDARLINVTDKLAANMIKNNNLAEARKYYQALVELLEIHGNQPDQNLGETHHVLANVCLQLGDYPAAILNYKKALQRKSDLKSTSRAEVFSKLAQSYQKAGDELSASAYFDSAIVAQKQSPSTSITTSTDDQLSLGLIKKKSQEWSTAETIFAELLNRAPFSSPSEPRMQVLIHLADVQMPQKKYTQADKNYQSALDLAKSLNVTITNEEQLRIYENLASMAFDSKTSKAITYLQTAIIIQQEKLQRLDENLVNKIANLAELSEKANQLTDAASNYANALSLSEKIGLPVSKHYTLLYNLARIKMLTKDYAAAETLLVELLKGAELKVLDNLAAAQFHFNLGIIYEERDIDFAKALAQYQKALNIREQILAPNDKDLLDTYMKIGYCLKQLGRDTEALTYLEKTATNTSASSSPQYASSDLIKAEIMLKEGKWHEAQKALLASLKSLEGKSSQQDNLIAVYSNLGYTYLVENDYHNAEIYYNKALALQKQKNLTDSPDYYLNLSNLALIKLNTGQLSAAKTLYQQVIKYETQTQGLANKSTRINISNYVILLQNLHQDDEAISYLQQLDEHFTTNPEPDEHIKVLEKLGSIYRESNQDNLALAVYQKLIKAQRSSSFSKDISFARNLLKVGKILKDNNRIEEASNYFAEAIPILEQNASTNQLDYAFALNDLGEFYRKSGQYDQSEGYYLKAIKAFEQAEGPYLSDVAVVLNNLAMMMTDEQRYEEAEQYYLRTIDIEINTNGSNSTNLGLYYTNLGIVRYNLGNHASANELLNKALTIFRKNLGEAHPNTLMVQDYLSKME